MIHLDAKTDYSFMRGFGTPKQWAERAKEIGTTALGVADYCSTWGHAPMIEAFKDTGVKIIPGVQLPVVEKLDKDPKHALVTLLPMTDAALRVIYDMTTLAFSQLYYRARLTWEQVQEAIDADCIGIVNDALISDYAIMEKVRGLYLGARPVKDGFMAMVQEGDMPVVVAPSPRYPSIKERRAYELVQAISSNQRFGELQSDAIHLARESELKSAFRSVGIETKDEWFKEAEAIASACNAKLPKATMPKFKQDKPEVSIEFLCTTRANDMGISLADDGPYARRFAREMSVIKEKNFEDYFLIVADMVRAARAHMLVGPGRGSAGGSLVAYLLGITHVDPLKFGTLFERFIDITRPDWPDIDIDFPDTKREIVFDYLREKYGRGHFARIGTLSEFGGKSALNDTAKATGVPIQVARDIGKWTEGAGQGKVVPFKIVFDLDETKPALEKHPSLLMAAEIDGHVRHHGVHAAGCFISNEPVTTYGALRDGVIAMDMKDVEKTGLIKMDVLGLKTLSVIQDCCDQIGIDPYSLYELSWDDQEVFEKVFNADRVTGIFQFEGHAVRTLTKQIKVERFEDLCAITSLARPGPLVGGAADLWVKRRVGNEDFEIDPLIEPHLRSTYGTIVYQEQAMSIVRHVAGFDEGAVNGFRRAIGKKDPEKLKLYREQFLAGAQAKGMTEEAANDLWDEMANFGSYAFNWSHAVAYSMISYMAAWLKTKHPLEFALSQLRNTADEDQAKHLLRELNEEGYQYVPFSHERSAASWSIIDGKLYGGFDSVRGVGSKTAATLLAKREADPEGWLDKLTDSQRDRITRENCTPWHDLTYFGKKYADVYKDADSFRAPWCPNGIRGPVIRIKDIPDQKGNYAFMGRVVRKVKKDKNSEEELAKRNGKRETRNTFHINLWVQDDGAEIGMTINRFKAGQFEWLLDENLEGRDFLVRGSIIEDGRSWLFVDNIVEAT